ncbi:hypothetical protein [Spirosoma montaniterrae]|uniref:Uncharacterized protein n=1 Tax=Spirosoma montaniterrae TaxID=1178516 RepID=A0A1P9WZ37_9BACT|nr:hypothetical protein [Spirosoma montaniterrae]AQG80646.1 hypothetical protein AWR27_15730 [Spirosoma montaniterrae]
MPSKLIASAWHNIRPKQSVLFSGEVRLRYFVYNGSIPRQQMLCNLNIDMVGPAQGFYNGGGTYWR